MAEESFRALRVQLEAQLEDVEAREARAKSGADAGDELKPFDDEAAAAQAAGLASLAREREALQATTLLFRCSLVVCPAPVNTRRHATS